MRAKIIGKIKSEIKICAKIFGTGSAYIPLPKFHEMCSFNAVDTRPVPVSGNLELKSR